MKGVARLDPDDDIVQEMAEQQNARFLNDEMEDNTARPLEFLLRNKILFVLFFPPWAITFLGLLGA